MDTLLTETDVAKHFGITTRTLQVWRKTGTGPQFLDVGRGTIRYRPSDVLAYEKRRATGGEIPERAQTALTRASSALTMILSWKMPDGSRQIIEGIRQELLALAPKEEI